MRFFAMAADLAMGAILGVFLFAALRQVWPSADLPIVLVGLLAASVVVVMFRRPNGSLAAWRNRT